MPIAYSGKIPRPLKSYAQKVLDDPSFRSKHADSARAYRKKHPAKYRAYLKSYREKNRNKIINYRKSWSNKNRHRYKAYRLKQREKRLADKRTWNQKNKLRVSQYAHAYNLKNRDAIRSKRRFRYLKNKDDYIVYAMNRRSLKMATARNLSRIKDYVLRARAMTYAICYYCNKTIPARGCHIDHIIALSRGGPHCVENLCISCPSCNLTKSSKRIGEWIRGGQQIFPI